MPEHASHTRTVDLEPVIARVFGSNAETIRQYREILATRGIEWGLIGPREVDRLWDRHIFNSAAVAELVPPGARVADVGSGAGLPGIPLAVLRPDLVVELVEPLLRRSNFLSQTVNDLGITDRVTVRRARAEEVGDSFDVVLSRALAPLDRLVRWCAPLTRADGAMLAIKGSSAEREIKEHAAVLHRARLRADVVTLRAAPEVSPATVVRLRRA